ncbi:hypothetical protein KR009_011052 [Drosophila setifemur]|nr:hypothetical protein KR009_011052 [Drosophila setifemur]
MSQPDNAAREQIATNEVAVSVPEACKGCRGQLPRATAVEVEDLANTHLEKLIRKANMAQKMLNEVLEQLQHQQQESQCGQVKEKKSRHRSSSRGKRPHKGRRHGHGHSGSSSNSISSLSDCELIPMAEQEEEMPRKRRHIRDDRKRDRSRSRGRSRGHSRGRSHGRSRSRSYTDPHHRPSRALSLALPVRISV